MENNELRLRIGKQIVNRREFLNISQGKLSKMTGLTKSTISKVENGRFSASLDLLEKFETALGIEFYLKLSEE